jgi:hypothetical protein
MSRSDALPDISDVQVIIHTPWESEPPDVIEAQVNYPIVTFLLVAPQVKAVRAQTMLGDSYVYAVFQDGGMFIGHVLASLNIFSRLVEGCRRMFIPQSGRMLRGRAGCTNTLWWTEAISTAWLIFAAFRTGTSTISLKQCQV